ncbi:hypothetical protein [Mycolicibacterium vaccae]|jgi:hypothetical protein|uniref:Secreted protein n=1 Tax=Mycolicibacterium vaccae ATCC 25954 TaxID=1194972 RepID=K0UWI7_MYCVA|nr:hypothetical protein [Mycolicibacterium vaccae]ANI41770.1 hypothetical protein MYVA_4696 [Mycolicibacterium vaccae 95051]EJZ06933.1 hypothetical protein MVAC_20393 [Mycolicibacterium vaccae ATCC 25954]
MVRDRFRRLTLTASVPVLLMTAPPAWAEPPGFPDLSGYPAVDAGAYAQDSPYVGGFAFTTPDGQQCIHNTMNSRGDPSRQTLSCDGPRPDLGPGTWQVLVATDAAATAEPLYPQPDPAIPTDPATIPAPLPAMHTITEGSIECGVDDTGVTACRVGDHGFVLTPTSTQLF